MFSHGDNREMFMRMLDCSKQLTIPHAPYMVDPNIQVHSDFGYLSDMWKFIFYLRTRQGYVKCYLEMVVDDLNFDPLAPT